MIERFLPQQMTEDADRRRDRGDQGRAGRAGMKDMGRVMAELKARHASELDMSKASGLVKAALR